MASTVVMVVVRAPPEGSFKLERGRRALCMFVCAGAHALHTFPVVTLSLCSVDLSPSIYNGHVTSTSAQRALGN